MSFLSVNLQFFAQEKTEKATPKKRQDTRKKGQVAKSQDINTALVLLAVFLTLYFTGEKMIQDLLNIFRYSFRELLVLEMTPENIYKICVDMTQQVAGALAPAMAAAVVAAVAANFLQFGFLFSAEPIRPKLEKINPIKGFKRIFSLRALVEFLKSSLKIICLGFVVASVLWKKKEDIFVLSLLPVGKGLAVVADLTIRMGLISAVVLLFLAILDYMYQRYDFEKNIRMSKQDIKDEFKNTEADPLIRSRIKQRQREMAARRMMQEIPDADVVITNPTHYAVALKYDETKRDAPYVVAKGADYIALKIKSVAEEHGVVIVENRPLARSLYEQTEIGDEIPEEFFKAVAEILAYVYKTKGII